jgi:uncharacterized integral membrane protein
MNAKLLLKTLFIILVALLLVLMGMNNHHNIDFTLPPILNRVIQQPAALMYLAFFAVGLLTGTIMTAGRGKKAGGIKSGKSEGR